MQKSALKITVTKAERARWSGGLASLQMLNAVAPVSFADAIEELQGLLKLFVLTWKDKDDHSKGVTDCVYYFNEDGTWNRSYEASESDFFAADTSAMKAPPKTPAKAKKK